MTAQLGFDALLSDAAQANEQRIFDRQTAHLPGSMSDGIAYYRDLIERHHAAMLEADVERVMALREDAHLLAEKLNGGEPGILADDDSPGYVLANATAAAPGTVPLWGQTGEFIITCGTMRVRIELDGIFGIGASYGFWPGFSAHAVDADRPFLSETGYRSFLGLHAEPSGLTPDAFCACAVEAHVKTALKGRLKKISR